MCKHLVIDVVYLTTSMRQTDTQQRHPNARFLDGHRPLIMYTTTHDSTRPGTPTHVCDDACLDMFGIMILRVENIKKCQVDFPSKEKNISKTNNKTNAVLQ